MKNSKDTKAPKQKLIRTENTEQKFKRSKLRHEQVKRRKEGEERAHEDGGMVG